MSKLAIDFCGIKSPNPFWLASAPPTNTGEQIMRAFDMGWGGAVWKTVGQQSTNVYSRFAAAEYQGRKMMGLTNIEVTSDRPIEVNLKEAYQVKKLYPQHAVILSIAAKDKQMWQELAKRSEDAGADGLELNFSCPHGLVEGGMGAAIGQNPAAIAEMTAWVKEVTKIPVLVKLTPNITDILHPAQTAVDAGADALALINTITSISVMDLDTFTATPIVGGQFSSGGYSGPAVAPIAKHMLARLALSESINVPISGMGGITNWRDAAEFIALGATSLQVCTAVMHHGYKIINDMLDGLNKYLDEKKFASVNELRGKALPHYSSWCGLDKNYRIKAEIDKTKCIGCQNCYISCLDGGHQCIHTTKEPCQAYHGVSDHAQNIRTKQPSVQHEVNAADRVHVPFIDEEECIGCNLCALVCPVNCIKMVKK